MGNFLRVKELQSFTTETPIVSHNLHISTQKHMLQSELETCLLAAQADFRDSYDSIQLDTEYWTITRCDPPKINLCLNVPNIPKQKAPATSRVSNTMVACRKVWHLEVDAAEVEKLKVLVRHGKKKGIFKEYMGQHIHTYRRLLTGNHPRGTSSARILSTATPPTTTPV
jgi:hypothetical protein